VIQKKNIGEPKNKDEMDRTFGIEKFNRRDGKRQRFFAQPARQINGQADKENVDTDVDKLN